MRAAADMSAAGTATVPSPALVELTLGSFRNYRHCKLAFGHAPVVLTGANGAGKTNLLEAVSLLSPGTGLRRARLDELDQSGNGPWHINALLDSTDGRLQIATGRDRVKDRRQVAVNDKPLSSSTGLAELVSVLWLTPALDRLFVEAGSNRRRFLDRLVLAVTSSHATQVRAFERAMRERMKLLRGQRPDSAWLTVLERRMAESAVAVAAARLDLINHLQSIIDQRLDPFDRPKLKVKGDVECWLQHNPALDVEERIASKLALNRTIDADFGTTALGTHRSDLAVFDYATMEPAQSCSTGRQKALLIAMILGQARLRAKLRGSLPILLLDEVTAHLDRQKRCALMTSIRSIGAQTWLTGTDLKLFDGIGSDCQFLTIAGGRVSMPYPGKLQDQ